LDKITLSNLQTDFLREFFTRKSSFFLSGGAALVGFYFGHRKTEDLDLFTLENEIEKGVLILKEVANSLPAELEAIQTSPDFRRFLLKRNEESIVIDLIRETVYQINREKLTINGIRVDSQEEILANKLCTLLSRSEIRDLVDVYELESAGYRVEDVISEASKKDTGLSGAQLVWVLGQIQFGDDARIPGEISVEKMREYLAELIERLAKLSFPK
jgi:predicted nucleotidyltransferase component of viral defense system